MVEKAKKLKPLQRVQAKAIYNFKARQRAAAEEEKMKQMLDDGTFFDEQLDLSSPVTAGGETYEPTTKKGK